MNENYTYRGIMGECSSNADPFNDGSFQPIYEYLNIEKTNPWHIYTISNDEKSRYDNRTSHWQFLGVLCYVPNNPGLFVYAWIFKCSSDWVN